MMTETKVIKRHCRDCSIVFEVPPDEQQWFADRGFQVPKRCKLCRSLNRDVRNGRVGEG